MEFTSSQVRLVLSLSFFSCNKLTLPLNTLQTGEKRTLFDAETAGIVPKVVHPESEQEPNESRRLASLSPSCSLQPNRCGDQQIMVQTHRGDQGQGHGGSDKCQDGGRGRAAGKRTSARAVWRQARTKVLQDGEGRSVGAKDSVSPHYLSSLFRSCSLLF